MKRIFEVELEHRRHGPNWDRRTVSARTAQEAINKAVSGENTMIRAIGVRLVAEAER